MIWTLYEWVTDGWSLEILNFIRSLCMHRDLDEDMKYVFRMLFEWPITWYNFFCNWRRTECVYLECWLLGWLLFRYSFERGDRPRKWDSGMIWHMCMGHWMVELLTDEVCIFWTSSFDCACITSLMSKCDMFLKCRSLFTYIF
jgi:hypothetical protein